MDEESALTTSAERFGDDFGGERMWGLKELPYPDAIAFAPETIGWLVLAIGFLLLLGWLGWRLYERRLADGYRRDALRELDDLTPSTGEKLPLLLRRTALVAAARADVASLRGSEWIGWLNASAGRELFDPGDAELLDRLAYSGRPVSPEQWRHLMDRSRRWVEVHRPPMRRRRNHHA